ncbi:MAG: response regulator [Nitrospiraceae bacterium]|nr:response regulator [Nitrospiraceae bacterium]
MHNGSEALDLLSHESGNHPFDLALLDVDMGSPDGVELARAIRRRTEGALLRLVLLTSLGRRGDAKTAREAGVAAYLTKPIRERQLHDCLVAVMTQNQSQSCVSAPKSARPLITRHSLAETKAKVDLRILLAEDNVSIRKWRFGCFSG